MQKILITGLVTGVVLLLLSFLALQIAINLFPGLTEEYYNPAFRESGGRDILFYLHPFVLSFALAWFWQRFKDMFEGSFLFRGLELGVVYALVAVLPSMWITFSAINISLAMVATWFFYGLAQAVVAGWIFAKMNP